MEKFDGFLFPVEPNIAPALYGKILQSVCGSCVKARDAMEKKLFTELPPSKKLILGDRSEDLRPDS